MASDFPIQPPRGQNVVQWAISHQEEVVKLVELANKLAALEVVVERPGKKTVRAPILFSGENAIVRIVLPD